MRKTTEKRAGAILAAVVVAAFMGLLAVVMLAGYFGSGTDGSATVMILLCALIYLAIAVGVIAALFQRLREIRGGEEDEAKKY